MGLIGGSLAKSIHQVYPEIKLIAHASRAATLRMAFEEGVIENGDFLPLSAFGDCDILFLCSPVKVNVAYLKELKNMLRSDCILSDVGSVKGDITSAVEELGLSRQFIGGHPMAGSEMTGYQNASAYLLENAYYILTVTDDFPKHHLQFFDSFLSSLGAITMVMRPQEHDFATACISHLPHIIAASLVNFVKESDKKDATLKTIAAGGFRDITRIASSSPLMWQHICTTNKEEISHAYELYRKSLDTFMESIIASDDERIIDLFTSAKDYRDNLPIRQNGALPSAFEFYLDLADETGGIATIATMLASNNISIKNIGIVHNREFQQGVLHIELYDREAMDKAIRILKKNYTVHE